MIHEATASAQAVIDTRDLWSHNRHLINDERIETAVLRTLGTCATTASENDIGIRAHPRLVMCDPETVAYSLVEALTMDRLWNMHAPCDRCLRAVQPTSRLWITAGASVVEIHCCLDCAAELDRDYSNVVWR